MKTQIQTLLEELYQLDPELRNKEKELKKILKEMLTNRPDTHFDERFKEELREKIQTEIARMEKKPVKKMNFFTGFFVGGMSIALASYLVFTIFSSLDIPGLNRTEAPLDFGFKKESIKKESFGKLSFQTSAWGWWVGNARGMGGWGDATMSKMAPSDTSLPSPLMPPYEMKIYKYIYTGSGYAITENEMGVLQKKKNTITSANARSILSNFSLSSLDVSKFTDLRLNNLNMSEEKEYGLNLSIDLNEGNIFVTKDWSRWPQVICQTEECYNANRPKIADIPSESDMITLAKRFVEDYKIDVSSYGTPYVNQEWRAEYDRATDKNQVYIPEIQYVVYPLRINDMEVFEEYGQSRGITVGIDIKNHRVAEVNGIEKLEFEESKYAVESDFQKILQTVEKGGRFGYNPASITDPNVKFVTTEIKIGEPILSYVHLYDSHDGRSYEYIVPSLVFPVMEEPKLGEYFPKKIIVPLIKDFFSSSSSPEITPFNEGIKR